MRFLQIALIVFGTAIMSNAASFDCSKASSATEKSICASEILSHRDQALAILYKEKREYDESAADAQKDWITNVQIPCKGDKACLLSAYDRRFDDFLPSIDGLDSETIDMVNALCPHKPDYAEIIRHIFIDHSEDEDTVTAVFETACWLGAYQEGSLFFHSYDMLAIPVPVFKGDDNEIIGIGATTTVPMADVDEINGTIHGWSKSRGIGDCSSSGSWKFIDRNLALQNYQVDSLCDGEFEANQFFDINDFL